MNTNDFYTTLFDDDDFTCFARVKEGTTIYHHSAPIRERCEFFSINAIDNTKDNDPVTEAHDPKRPRRADVNCVKYRNFLVEMDGCDLNTQKMYIRELMFPYATAVYSGGKSIHFVLSLEVPLATREEYDRYWLSIEAVFKQIGAKIDGQCKNPTRLSRAANSLRASSQLEQSLLKVNSRVSNSDFISWLEAYDVHPDQFKRVEEPQQIYQDTSIVFYRLDKRSKVSCPSCGHHRRFRNYVDQHGSVIPGSGMCDRIESCKANIYPWEVQPLIKWKLDKR